MQRIYKILSKENPEIAKAIGLLESENETHYVFVSETEKMKFFKKDVILEDIYEKGSGQYEVEFTNDKSETQKLQLERHCFGGCG